jgi:pimeloyl-ACP methyl ester carboxylesterase
VADFVLVHGTTQGPTGWDRLVEELAQRGHRSAAVDLAAVPAESLEELVGVVQMQVPADFDAPIVAAHSGSGPLLPGVTQLLGASRAVWLAALIPSRDSTLLHEIETAPEVIFNEEWIGENPTTDQSAAAYFLFHDCDLETLRWALSTVRLFAPPFLYSSATPTFIDIPSTYIAGTHDRVIRPDWSRRAARSRLGADFITLDAGHCPHVSRAAQLAEILDKLSASEGLLTVDPSG